jgi:hypothetical protein
MEKLIFALEVKKYFAGSDPEPPKSSPHSRILLISSWHQVLGLPNELNASCFSAKILYAFLISSIRAACPTHPINAYLIVYSNIFFIRNVNESEISRKWSMHLNGNETLYRAKTWFDHTNGWRRVDLQCNFHRPLFSHIRMFSPVHCSPCSPLNVKDQISHV